MSEILSGLTLGLLIWYWSDTSRAKEIALKAGLNACNHSDLQFLDQTVERKATNIRINERQQFEICRLYHFEFTYLGDTRYKGRIILMGHRVSQVQLDPYRI